MAIRVTPGWAIALIIVSTCWAASQAQDVARVNSAVSSLDFTSGIEDYIIENRRQYATNIREYETQVAELRSSYLAQVATVNMQTTQLEEQLRLIDEKLNPLELLDEINKHCVQKYRSILVTIATVKTSITNCASSANSYLNSLMSSPEYTMRLLSSYYTYNFNTSLTDCTKKYANSTLNYTICVTQAISTTNAYTISNRETFSTQMKATKCSGDGRIEQALRCSFMVNFNAVSSIGRVMSSIEDCIAGVSMCPPCSTGATCDHVLYVKPESIDLKNTTMPNPFYGFSGKLSCLLLDFENLPA